MGNPNGKRPTLVKRQQLRSRRSRAVAILGCMVVLVTAIALMVPAVTMTRETAGNGITLAASTSAGAADKAGSAITSVGLNDGLPAQSFEQQVRGEGGAGALTVSVEAPEGALPANTQMKVEEVTDGQVIDAAKEAAADSSDGIQAEKARAVAVDITFTDEKGNPVQPMGDVQVSMKAPAIAKQDEVAVVHVDDEQKAEVVESQVAPAPDASKATADTVTFEASSFSVYALVYTVDFYNEIDGQTYQFSIMGGDTISLKDLVVTLGLVKEEAEAADEAAASEAAEAQDPAADAQDQGAEPAVGPFAQVSDLPSNEAVESEGEGSGENENADADVGSDEPQFFDMTDDWQEVDPNAPSDDDADAAEPETALEAFINNIDSVTFSNPELIWVERIDSDTTAGELKQVLDLHPEYSGDPTPEKLAEMDAKQFIALDWALLSLKAFNTEELLTITMKDGTVYKIKVTDACEDPLGLDGRTFSVVSKRNGGTGNGKYYSVKRGTTANQNYGTYIAANETVVSNDGKYSRETDTAWLFEYDVATGGYFMSQYGSGTYLVMNPNTTAKGDGTVAVSLTNEAGKKPVYVSKNYTESVDQETGKYSYTWDGTYRISNKPLTESFDPETNQRTTNEADLMFLWNYGGTFWVDKVGNDANQNQNAVMQFCLPELDPNKNDAHSGSHKATLINVHDLQVGQSVVIYQRVKQSDNTFKSFAIADNASNTDGRAELVRVWNSGDSVYWKDDPAVLWTFKQATNPDGTPNGYYFFVNEKTGRYLAAKADGTIIQDLKDSDYDDLLKVNMREDHVQVDLPGLRSDTAYTSKIANWDYSKSYTSAPKVNDADGNGTPESVSSESLADSQEFYFAVLDPIVQKQLTEVDTVDNTQHGITMTMYDFSQNNINSNRLPYMTSVIGSDGWSPGVYTPGLVSRTLAQNPDGTYADWPTTAAGNSLGNIFTANNGQNYTVDSWDANHLFLQNVYDSTGYFRYSSFENYASFNTNTGDFAVYEQIGVPATRKDYDNDWDRYYKKRGNFMPYDALNMEAKPRENLVPPVADDDKDRLDPDDPRRGEDLYLMYETRDYFFGMVMDAKFQQDKDGLNSHGDPVRFDFNGDDDMWIYIDGVLVLDIGGVHDAFHGYIDFTDGTVHVDKQKTNTTANDTTIKEMFFKAHKYPDGSDWPESDGINSEKSKLFFKDNTFADYSSHTFKMIYMERGAGASNLEMQFNLTTLTQDMFKVTKEMPETTTGHTVQDDYGNAAFFYKAYKVTTDPNTHAEVRTPIKKTDTLLVKNDAGKTVTKTYGEIATYEDGKTPLVWKDDETFELRPGHTALIPVEHHGVRYYVEEVEPEPGTSKMLDNYDVENSSPEAGQPENKQLKSDVKTVQQRTEVIYKNKPADGLINELRITKNLHGDMLKDSDGKYIDVGAGSPYFEYVVYLEDNSGKMVPYSLGEYYIIDKYGRFVYYTKDDAVRHYLGFAKNADGTYSYYNVDPAVEGPGSEAVPQLGAEVEGSPFANPKITEQFGAEGYVGDIRDGDTLVIVGLLEGTHFIVDELTHGSGITTSETDEGYIGGTKYLYEDTDVDYVHVRGEDIPEDAHATGHLFNDPTNIGEIRAGLSKHDDGSQIAAEGDIKMDQDAEVTVHNRTNIDTLPILVKKNWEGIDANDPLLKDVKVKVTLGRYVLKDKAGTLTIQKTGVPDGSVFTAYYTVKDAGENTVAVVRYSPQLKEGVAINVPPGTYTVTETVKNQDQGYNWNHGTPEVSRIEIADDGSGEAVFTCNPVLKAGNLKVTSSYTVPSGGTVDFSGVRYTVYEGDENSTKRATFPNGDTVPVITYEQAKNGFTVEGLKVGKYTVKEDGVQTEVGEYCLSSHAPALDVFGISKVVAQDGTVEAVFGGEYSEKGEPATIIVRWQEHWGNHNYVELLRSEGEYRVGDSIQLSYYRQTHNPYMQMWINGSRVSLPVGQYDGSTPKLETRTIALDNQTTTIDFVNDQWGDMAPKTGRNPSIAPATRGQSASSARMMAKAPLRVADDNVDSGDEGNDESATSASLINYGEAPEAEAGKKYVDDVTFKMADPENEGEQIDYTVELTQDEIRSAILSEKAAWTWDSVTAKAGLPIADEDGNLYYYYIKSVEEEGLSLYTTTTVKLDGENTAFVVGKDKHFNAETNAPEALEVNNELAFTQLDVRKAWAPENSAPAGAEVTVELYYAKRPMAAADGLIPEENRKPWPTSADGKLPDGYAPVNGADELASAGISPTEIVLGGASNPVWDGSFQHLPTAIVGENGTVYELDYYVKEVSVMVPGKGEQEVDGNAVDETNKFTTTYSKSQPQPSDVNSSDGTVTVLNTRESVQVTVKKAWDPVPTDPNASATVELHRLAKMTKGTIGVVLKDDNGAGIEGAVYWLFQKNGEEWDLVDGATATTDVNGRASVSGLEPGTYKLVQHSTPTAYTMATVNESDTFGYITETGELTVLDQKTDPQTLWTDNKNKRKVTAGVATLTVTGTAKVYDPATQAWGMSIEAPVAGATVVLYKDGSVYKQGLQTDDGQVSVAGLPAGSYYFMLTSVTDDYVMPSEADRQSTSFVIEDKPGTEQHATVSIDGVNAASRGYVAVTLKQEGKDDPIGGATFTLSGDGVSLTATTDEDGVATFGTPDRKLNAGEYVIRQTSTADGYKTSSRVVTITKDDWSEYDNNQTVAVDFTNVLAGKATVTVTVQKENNGGLVANAIVQLMQGESVARTGKTDANGVVTFSDVPEGTYVVHQVDTGNAGSDYEVAANPAPFTVVEGDAGQQFNYMLTDEAAARTATLQFWTKQGKNTGYNWQLVDELTLKINKTYSFTALVNRNIFKNDGVDDANDHLWYYQDQSNHQAGDFLNQSNIQPLNGENWNDGSYTFTFTPKQADATYSIVLVTDWGNSDIYSITRNEDADANSAASPMMSAASIVSLVGNRMSAMSMMAAVDGAAVDDDGGESGSGDAADDDGNDDGVGDGSTPVATDARPNTLPIGLDDGIANQYIEDASFAGQTYTITSRDKNWQHAFAPEDKCDADGNLYYYYVVETAHTPDSFAGYYIGSYSGDPRSESGDITITNTQQRGGLTITKAVTVNGGSVPASAQTIADGAYTFTVTGPSYPEGREVTITVTDGVASASTGSTNEEDNARTVVLDGLYAGTYTITETGSTNPNGITLAQPQTVTVNPGSQASVNVAAFTNNLETTQLVVNKVWSDGATVNHSDDVITYKLYRIPRVVDGATGNVTAEYDPELVTSATGMTGRLTAGNTPTPWAETISDLPKSGTYTPTGGGDSVAVTYKYYVSEDPFTGYHASSHGEQGQDAFEVTITNTPNGSFDKPTGVVVEKAWKDAAGNLDNATATHDNDTVTFRLEQNKYVLKANGSDGHPHEYVPVRVTLRNSKHATSDFSTVLYVRKGSSFTVTPEFDSGSFISTAFAYLAGHSVRGNGFDKNFERWSGYTFGIGRVNGAKEVTLELQYDGDAWGSSASSTVWANTYGSDHEVYTEEQLLSKLVTSGNPVATQTFDYSMALNAAKDNTVLTPLEGADGEGLGAGKWKGRVADLPHIQQGSTAAEFYVYTYEVTEVKIGSVAVDTTNQPTGWDGQTPSYLVKWSQDAQTGEWTITNQKKPSIDMTLRKVASDYVASADAHTETLKGATFKVEKFTSSSFSEIDGSWAAVTKQDIANTGVFSFEGLGVGYYQATEVEAPAGYIKSTSSPRFQVVEESGALVVQLLDGTPANMFKVENSAEGDASTLYFGNTPGEPLPVTGGAGTQLTMLLGGALVVLAAVVLARGRGRALLASAKASFSHVKRAQSSARAGNPSRHSSANAVYARKTVHPRRPQRGGRR